MLVRILRRVLAAEPSPDCITGIHLYEYLQHAKAGAVSQAEPRAGVLAWWRISPARAETELEGGDRGAIVSWQARQENVLSVEEAAVGREEADWLGVEDWVGFPVHASTDEEDCKARVEEAVVDRVCNTLSVHCS